MQNLLSFNNFPLCLTQTLKRAIFFLPFLLNNVKHLPMLMDVSTNSKQRRPRGKRLAVKHKRKTSLTIGVRTTPNLNTRFRRVAEASGKSISAVMRECVEAKLAELEASLGLSKNFCRK